MKQSYWITLRQPIAVTGGNMTKDSADVIKWEGGVVYGERGITDAFGGSYIPYDNILGILKIKTDQ